MTTTKTITPAADAIQALRLAADLIPIARRYFPKSIQNADRFTLENTCAAISKALHEANEQASAPTLTREQWLTIREALNRKQTGVESGAYDLGDETPEDNSQTWATELRRIIIAIDHHLAGNALPAFDNDEWVEIYYALAVPNAPAEHAAIVEIIGPDATNMWGGE